MGIFKNFNWIEVCASLGLQEIYVSVDFDIYFFSSKEISAM